MCRLTIVRYTCGHFAPKQLYPNGHDDKGTWIEYRGKKHDHYHRPCPSFKVIYEDSDDEGGCGKCAKTHLELTERMRTYARKANARLQEKMDLMEREMDDQERRRRKKPDAEIKAEFGGIWSRTNETAKGTVKGRQYERPTKHTMREA